MSNNRESLKIINEKKESREIVKRILEFGVTEEQKIDIMINLGMSLEKQENVRDIVNFLKKFTSNFNLEENSNKIHNDSGAKSKIILN